MKKNKTLFETKVFYTFVILVVAVILFFGLIYSKMTFDILYEEALDNAKADIYSVDANLETMLLSIERETLYFIVNENYQTAISVSETNETRKFQNAMALSAMLNTLIAPQSTWESVFYYYDGEKSVSSYKDYSQEFWKENEEKIALFEKSSDKSRWWIMGNGGEDAVLSFVKKVYTYYGEYKGILEVNMPCNNLADRLAAAGKEGMYIFFTDSEGRVLSSTVEDGNGYIGDFLNLDDTKNTILRIENERAPIRTVAVIDKKYFRKSSNAIFPVVAGLVFILIFAVVLLVDYLSKRLSEPIVNIENVVKMVSDGRRDVRVTKIPKGELGELSLRINEMIKNIDRLIGENAEVERQKRVLEMNYIQMQINPHFLYNALESVCGMIAISENKAAIHMISSISSFYRGILKNSGCFIPLKQEIRIVNMYLEIMKLRYPNLFTYQISLDDEVMDVRMIKLVLQPVVENCIVHGFRDKKRSDYLIIIEGGEEKEDAWEIVIKDNGCGMELDEMRKIQEYIQGQESYDSERSFALYNVNRRLKLHFGDEYGIFLHSDAGEGMEVGIRVPFVKMGEGEDVQTIGGG